MNRSNILPRRLVSAAIMLALFLQGCTFSLAGNPFEGGIPGMPVTPSPVPVATRTPYPALQTTFVVKIPEPLLNGETIALVILDEVTGLSINSAQYPLTARDAQTYATTIPLPGNAIVKYRYVRLGGAGAVEDTTLGTAIRYRIHNTATAAEVQDTVADWSDKNYNRASGTILGQIYNADSGAPIPNILMTAGGIQFVTDSFGRFELNGLPAGTHQLTAYSLDGYYQPFQQGAVVADGQSTIVDLRIKPARLVNVTFMVAVPGDTVPGVPVRIAGNLLQLGNTFADLQGGMSVVTDRMPIMNLQADGRYAVRLGLPAGAYIQYKYTLGDGYWNAEHKADGGWVLRELIVPEQDVVIEDAVSTWLSSGASSPILFEVNVPAVTPPSDIVYMQFNLLGWSEPIPMWPMGNNRWAYKLYSPLNFMGSFAYRYCRNGQCGSADDNQTVGASPPGLSVATSLLGQDIVDTVGSWKWYENPEVLPLVGNTIAPRSAGFAAGVELQPYHRPNLSYFAQQAFANTKAIGANFVVVTPTWSVTSVSPLRFSTAPGKDPLWIDSAIMIQQARNAGLNAAVFPMPQFAPSADSSVSASTQFWRNAPRDAAWWQTFFTRYRAFLVNYADLAAQSGAQSIILGGEWVTPALPGGLLPDGTSSNVPADAEAQWRSILQDVRTRFKGQVLWALPYERSSFSAPVSFLRDVDGIYLLWSTPLATSATATKTDYANEAGRLLDNEVFPLSSLLGKPIILAVSYPSASGAPNGCIANGAGGCLDVAALSRPNTDISAVSLSLQTQADIYEAMLIAVNARPWVAGFISRGFFLPVALQDKSISVHGKPAANVLWYWFPRMLGVAQ